jgi:uncharacterized protein YdeI (YjbR/CyaY-like superfamily)
MEIKQGLPILSFDEKGSWEEWLAEHHQASPGLWLKIAKKDTGIATVTYAEALDVALCYGWIDGQKGAFDATFWLQKFTPRGPRSIWSKVNRAKALALIEEGRMKPAGLEAVEQAKRNGRWEQAYDAQSTASVPDDLQKELDRNPEAAAFFATLNSVNRYAVLHRIQEAKKPETRARRIEKFVAMLERHEKLHPA